MNVKILSLLALLAAASAAYTPKATSLSKQGSLGILGNKKHTPEGVIESSKGKEYEAVASEVIERYKAQWPGKDLTTQNMAVLTTQMMAERAKDASYSDQMVAFMNSVDGWAGCGFFDLNTDTPPRSAIDIMADKDAVSMGTFFETMVANSVKNNCPAPPTAAFGDVLNQMARTGHADLATMLALDKAKVYIPGLFMDAAMNDWPGLRVIGGMITTDKAKQLATLPMSDGLAGKIATALKGDVQNEFGKSRKSKPETTFEDGNLFQAVFENIVLAQNLTALPAYKDAALLLVHDNVTALHALTIALSGDSLTEGAKFILKNVAQKPFAIRLDTENAIQNVLLRMLVLYINNQSQNNRPILMEIANGTNPLQMRMQNLFKKFMVARGMPHDRNAMAFAVCETLADTNPDAQKLHKMGLCMPPQEFYKNDIAELQTTAQSHLTGTESMPAEKLTQRFNEMITLVSSLLTTGDVGSISRNELAAYHADIQSYPDPVKAALQAIINKWIQLAKSEAAAIKGKRGSVKKKVTSAAIERATKADKAPLATSEFPENIDGALSLLQLTLQKLGIESRKATVDQRKVDDLAESLAKGRLHYTGRVLPYLSHWLFPDSPDSHPKAFTIAAACDGADAPSHSADPSGPTGLGDAVSKLNKLGAPGSEHPLKDDGHVSVEEDDPSDAAAAAAADQGLTKRQYVAIVLGVAFVATVVGIVIYVVCGEKKHRTNSTVA